MAGIRCLPSSTWLHPTHTSHFFKRSFFGRISIGQIPSWSHLCSGLQSSRALSIAVAASSTVKAQNGTVRVKGNKPRSSKLVDLEYAELNLKEKVGETPVEPPNWEEVFEDTRLPLMVDIGSGSGRFLILLAKRFSGSINFMGLEIRHKLVERSQCWVKELALTNIHFMVANATVSFGTLVSSYPGLLTCVSILCPDPHFKKRHHKRRILQRPLVDAIINNLARGGKILMQSDVHEVAIDMRQHFDPCFDLLEHVDIHHPNLCDDDGWILENPMGIRTEREIHAQSEGAKIYRRMYEKR